MLNAIKYWGIVCCVFFLTKTGNAQTCTSATLGAPVVNITFGDSANPPSQLPVAKTDNLYTTDLCPGGGFYTFASNSIGCHSNTWHTVLQDHTPGDMNGYMMLADNSVGSFYIDTIGLCGGTTYEFSVWLLNIDSANACGGGPGLQLPNVTLSIEAKDGTVLAIYNTGNIVVDSSGNPAWHQYSFFFTLPEAYSDVIMRLHDDVPPGGCGNDLAMDDITIAPCGLSLSAAFSNPIAANDTIRFCQDQNKTVTLQGTAQSGFSTTTFQWQLSNDSGKTWIDYNSFNQLQLMTSFIDAGPGVEYHATFQYRISASPGAVNASVGCRTVSNALTIIIDSIPVPKASNTSPVCVGSPVQFTAQSGDNYQWTGPNGFTSSMPSPLIPVSSTNNTGEYYVLATTIGGCSKQDSTNVIVSNFPVANAGRDTSVCFGSNTTLQASGGTTYAWTPVAGLSSTTIANPVASPVNTTSYTVTVGNQYNCTSKDNVLITVIPLPVINAGPDISLCAGSDADLHASGGGQYLWAPATGLSDATIANPVASPNTTTTYVVKVTSNLNCVNTDTVIVTVFQKPVANAGPDKSVSLGQSVTLNGTAGGDTSSYYWTPNQFISNVNVLNPVVTPQFDITYTLHVGSGTACAVATDDVFVHVNSKLVIPNAFSPNGDGINDTWVIEGISTYPGADIRVYNRYGQVIFHSENYSPWDGRVNGNPLPVGTYYYTLDRKQNLPLLSGWVEMVR